MNIDSACTVCICWVLAWVMITVPSGAGAQGAGIEADLLPAVQLPGGTVALRLQLADAEVAADIRYFGLEIAFDGDLVDFETMISGELMEGGLQIAGRINEHRIGASVTRTPFSDTVESNELMVVRFRVREGAAPGPARFVLSGAELYGSDGEGSPVSLPEFVEMEIEQAPDHRYTVAKWTFEDNSLLTSAGILANRDRQFGLSGAVLTGFSGGSSGTAPNTNGWDGEAGSSYWHASFSTVELINLTVSSRQFGSNTGPRDFRLEGSLDGETWDPVPGGEIQVGNNWTLGRLDELELPEQYENLPEIHLRWISWSGISIGDSTAAVGSAGTSRIDDVIIRGDHINPSWTGVWPGDANHDGEVNELDVLAIGANWLAGGPIPQSPSGEWAERVSAVWIPAEATFADTDGDGVVDHRDLRLVGLHFGRTHPAKQPPEKTTPVAEFPLGPLGEGESVVIGVRADSDVELVGLSYRLTIPDADGVRGVIESVEPGDWALEWSDAGKLVRFEWPDSETTGQAGAFVHSGLTLPGVSRDLMRVTVTADREWKDPVRLVLERASRLDDNGSVQPLMGISMEAVDSPEDAEEPDTPIDGATVLFQNYPNPFYPETVIGYRLSERAGVRLDLFDATGRHVRTLIRAEQEAGRHEITLHAGSLAGGIYIYRLITPGRVLSRRMVLVK